MKYKISYLIAYHIDFLYNYFILKQKKENKLEINTIHYLERVLSKVS